MVKKDLGIPESVIKDLDINEVENVDSEGEISPIVQPHQIRLPVPKKIIRDFDLEFQQGKKIKVKYNEDTKELIYKL